MDYIVSEGLMNGPKICPGRNAKTVAAALADVGLLPVYSRFPHEFSAAAPAHRHCPASSWSRHHHRRRVTALDVSIRAQVLNLLSNLQRKKGLTYLFIAHDLSVMRFICDRIAVIHKGQIVELSETEKLFANPLHPYTQALLSAIPLPDPLLERNKKLIIYDPACHEYAEDKPVWQEIEPGHFVLANQRERDSYLRRVADCDGPLTQ